MPHSWTSSHELKFQNEKDARKKTHSSKLQNIIGRYAGLQPHGRRELRSKILIPETSAGAGIRIIDQNLPSFLPSIITKKKSTNWKRKGPSTFCHLVMTRFSMKECKHHLLQKKDVER